MRVGFFGGTFDPPHNGHLAIARAAMLGFGFDRLIWVPTGRQPLKTAAPGASYEDRLAMVKLVCEREQAMEASALEAPLQAGANFTIDTLRKVRESLQLLDEIFVVVGADAFLDIRRWRDPDALLMEADWVVVSRPGFSLQDLSGLRLDAAKLAKVHLLTEVEVPVSATELRTKLRRDDDCREWIAEPVLSYIAERKLYRQT